MRYFRLYAIGVMALILFVTWGWNAIDLRINYAAVTGTVVTAGETCHLEKDGNFLLGQKTKSNDIPCPFAVQAVSPGGQFDGYSVETRTRIEYSYTSPVDHARHLGTTWRSGPQDYWPAPGESLTIYASRARAAASKYVTR